MKAFKVSIILPVYNVEKYLPACLESLVNQTLEEVEIVAVNDGSTDGSLAILEQWQERYPDKLFIYTTENHGVSHARNLGFSKSRGEYVWFVDSDDYVETDACWLLYEKATGDGNDLVLFRYYNVDMQSGERKAFPVSHYYQNFTVSERPDELPVISPYPWIKFIKRELFCGLAFPEGIRFEDLPIAYLLAVRAKSIGVVNECLYNYRKNVGFLGRLTPSTLDIKKAVLYLNSNMKQMGFLEKYKEELDFIAVRHFFYRFWKLLTNYENGKKELKLALIHELFDYIEQEIPDWRNNYYVKYALPAHLFQLLSLYGSREEMLRFVEACDGMDEAAQKAWVKEYKAAHEDGNAYPACLLTRQKEAREAYEAAADSPKIRQIFVESAYGTRLSPELQALLLRIKEEYPDLPIVQPEETEYGHALASSQYVISDSPLPFYYQKTEGQRFLLLGTASLYPLTSGNCRTALGDVGLWQHSMFQADCLCYADEKFRADYERLCMIHGICPAPYTTVNSLDIRNFLDGKPLSQVATPPKTTRTRVLLYTGRKLTAKLVREFNDFAARCPEKNFWLAYNDFKNTDTHKALAHLAPECSFLPLKPSPEKSKAWKSSNALISRVGLSSFYSTEKIHSLGKEEYRRYLGNAAFDEVIIASTDNLRAVAALLEAAPTASYVFDSFDSKRFQTERPYRHQIQFLCRLIKGSKCLLVPEELKERVQ